MLNYFKFYHAKVGKSINILTIILLRKINNISIIAIDFSKYSNYNKVILNINYLVYQLIENSHTAVKIYTQNAGLRKIKSFIHSVRIKG